MKLLHTGDLHLGKSLHESSLIEDQKIMLDQLVKALAEDDYAALIIAGDVYDRTIPSAEAVELLRFTAPKEREKTVFTNFTRVWRTDEQFCVRKSQP